MMFSFLKKRVPVERAVWVHVNMQGRPKPPFPQELLAYLRDSGFRQTRRDEWEVMTTKGVDRVYDEIREVLGPGHVIGVGYTGQVGPTALRPIEPR